MGSYYLSKRRLARIKQNRSRFLCIFQERFPGITQRTSQFVSPLSLPVSWKVLKKLSSGQLRAPRSTKKPSTGNRLEPVREEGFRVCRNQTGPPEGRKQAARRFRKIRSGSGWKAWANATITAQILRARAYQAK